MSVFGFYTIFILVSNALEKHSLRYHKEAGYVSAHYKVARTAALL